MDYIDQIDQPTLLIDEAVTRRNIQRMADRASRNKVLFRPHFKTHQSAYVGEWFRELGVTKITASSVEMAEYFARHGWDDILIAFSMNLRQVERINRLAENIHLGILVENHEALSILARERQAPLNVWVKVDVGNHRTGLDWQNLDELRALCEGIAVQPRLKLTGLLTHSGHTYHATGNREIIRLFREGVERLEDLRNRLSDSGFGELKISTGDTPGCSLCEDWSGIDEIRPGNFVFYDIQQVQAGSCRMEDVSTAVACPVIAKHADRGEVVIYGGAIHLSKDTVEVDGRSTYGLPALRSGNRWGEAIPGGWVDRLSQEHGILRLPPKTIDRLNVGDLVFILPAHVCLTVQVAGEYYTLEGVPISTLNKA